MDFKEYQEKSFRTMKREGAMDMILHCVMGMAGESGELQELPYPSGILGPR